jgi:hypothetical protein
LLTLKPLTAASAATDRCAVAVRSNSCLCEAFQVTSCLELVSKGMPMMTS